MYEIFADLHVHIGRSKSNKPIKITAARSLNFENIAKECVERKGISVVGIIDCASPYVIEDIEEFLKNGDAYEIQDGGIVYKDKVCIILGSEIETSEINEKGKTGSAHNLCYFPTLKDIKAFSKEMSTHISNITLSSQRANISAYELIDIVQKYNGILIPAHAFTPHKSFYGNCTDRLEKIFKEKYKDIPAIELGLSSDTFLADQISELETKTFLTNSDAHSLPKIAREYNKMLVENISFKEFVKAINNKDGRRILCNYGLDPKLGKYHRTYCETCEKNVQGNAPVSTCPDCDSKNITMGVFDRIETIKDKKESKSPENRPPYVYQVPLTFIPGLGGKTIDKLLNRFETEMNILHKLSKDDIEQVVGEKIANSIIAAREGKLGIQAGGGGVYGKVTTK
ncbi:MAG: TIGR00375 family protein [Clostridia bacterium]|nr:TIGR00375 family protein [Clostridia bacterium]